MWSPGAPELFDTNRHNLHDSLTKSPDSVRQLDVLNPDLELSSADNFVLMLRQRALVQEPNLEACLCKSGKWKESTSIENGKW